MYPRATQIAASLLSAWLVACLGDPATSDTVATIEYQGIQVRTSRSYADIKAFKHDYPGHLSPDAIEQVERTLRSATFGPTFLNEAALDGALEKLRFPGYGSFYANQLGAKLDSSLELVYVEIPQRGLNRYIAVRRDNNGTLSVVADFVAPAIPELVRVRHSSDRVLEFLSKDGAVVFRKSAA